IDLFPMVMHERRRGVDARIEAQEPGTASGLAGFVEIAGENLLLYGGRIAAGRRPAGRHVDPGEFEMRLVHRHPRDPPAGRKPSRAPAEAKSVISRPA